MGNKVKSESSKADRSNDERRENDGWIEETAGNAEEHPRRSE